MNYTLAWYIWFMLFAVIEGGAIFNKKKGDTLSEHLWRWASIKEKSNGWRLRRVGLTFTMVWIFIHIITGGWI